MRQHNNFAEVKVVKVHVIENISIFAKKNDHLCHVIKKANDHHLFGSNSSQLLTFNSSTLWQMTNFGNGKKVEKISTELF